MTVRNYGFAEVKPYKGLWNRWQVNYFAPGASTTSSYTHHRRLESARRAADAFASSPYERYENENEQGDE